MSKPLAIATSDWHFWHTAPVWRSNEPNWLEAMGRQLDQIIGASYRLNVPILNGGDIFDRFNPPPEVINFVSRKLQNQMYAVPGQHDLEHHVLENLNKTAFRTLQNTCIYFLETKGPFHHPNGFDLYYAPWGTSIEDLEVEERSCIKILLCHKYIWFNDKTRYSGPDIPSGRLSGLQEALQRFDFAIFGDNHIPFRKKIGRCQVINCGTMVRRKIDEKDYQTGYTILFDDGEIEFVPFDISKDVCLEIREKTADSDIDVSSKKFMEELQAMERNEVDYQTEIERKVEQLNRKDMQEQFAHIFENYGGKK